MRRPGHFSCQPVREPNYDETRFMFKIYAFNGDLRRQSKGGAIGNILIGALGALYTVFWCKAFLSKVKMLQ